MAKFGILALQSFSVVEVHKHLYHLSGRNLSYERVCQAIQKRNSRSVGNKSIIYILKNN